MTRPQTIVAVFGLVIMSVESAVISLVDVLWIYILFPPMLENNEAPYSGVDIAGVG
jgi:hypothetical protein